MADFEEFVKNLNREIVEDSTKPTTTTQSFNTNYVQPNVNVSSSTNTKKKMNIMIVSTHINQVNGYSKVIYNIINELAKHDWIHVTHYAIHNLKQVDIGRKYPNNVKVIDVSKLDTKQENNNGFGLSELPGIIKTEKPDIVFIYNDITVISNYIEVIRKNIQNRSFRIWAYIDMMYKFQPQGYIDIINRDVDRVFCFTKSWKDELKESGITRPVDVMNHGVDTSVFRTIPKELARQMLGLPKDIFLITSLNRNQPRKRLDLLVMAFVRLIIKTPMKPIFMLIVGDTGDNGGYKLFDIFTNELKLHGASTEVFGNRLLITSKNTCYKDEDINILYNVGDIGISCAEGEGFGLCSFEQMATGVPQIVPAINGYSEYCTTDNSVMISPKYRQYIPSAYNPITGIAEVMDIQDIVDGMEKYVFDDTLRTQHGHTAKDTVTKYTWESCTARFIKRLEQVLEDDD